MSRVKPVRNRRLRGASTLTGSGSHGMTGAKESTARMKTIAAQVGEHSSRSLYSRICSREEFHRKMKYMYLIPPLGRIRVLARDPLYSNI